MSFLGAVHDSAPVTWGQVSDGIIILAGYFLAGLLVAAIAGLCGLFRDEKPGDSLVGGVIVGWPIFLAVTVIAAPFIFGGWVIKKIRHAR